ncbi:hypothetical protein PTSG_06974 [Salpingoeca rosetta]|uniref:Uncharacterized protein n=1 Tax=Salpingoeca rosetta (strain ATCC 50818 / BSB-021) TaxID=946362 RepID=F2UFC4_SALR5|nr:uncharacterized protein PTSG_06974 [Salpingoeca rosetta]EGD75324.1 hypothetical protein PTSG_06974 [Salpingoeca rosetta]|eukprot:XP_004992377.1 hypothetical protein PTSG_06974 [Salpingoeca rosetta]
MAKNGNGKRKGSDIDLDKIIAAKKQQQTPLSFYVTAGLLNAIVPVFLFATVLMLDVISNAIVVVIGIAVTVASLQYAYQNVSRKLMDKIALKRREAAHKLVLQERKQGKGQGLDVDSM